MCVSIETPAERLGERVRREGAERRKVAVIYIHRLYGCTAQVTAWHNKVVKVIPS